MELKLSVWTKWPPSLKWLWQMPLYLQIYYIYWNGDVFPFTIPLLFRKVICCGKTKGPWEATSQMSAAIKDDTSTSSRALRGEKANRGRRFTRLIRYSLPPNESELGRRNQSARVKLKWTRNPIWKAPNHKEWRSRWPGGKNPQLARSWGAPAILRR